MMKLMSLAAALVLAFASSSSAADSTPDEATTIYLELMPGSAMAHVIIMPSMARCLVAIEHTPAARCTEVRKAKPNSAPMSGLDTHPASGPGQGPLPSVVYTAID